MRLYREIPSELAKKLNIPANCELIVDLTYFVIDPQDIETVEIESYDIIGIQYDGFQLDIDLDSETSMDLLNLFEEEVDILKEFCLEENWVEIQAQQYAESKSANESA